MFTKRDGLPHNVVNVVFQDSRGFLWVGTLNGLAKYDGYSFTVFRGNPRDTNTIGGSIITAITEDRAGNIWVGTQTEGVSRLNIRTGKWSRFLPSPQNGLTEEYITALACDSLGTVWVGTPSGLLKFNNSSGMFVEIPLTTTYRTVSSLYVFNNVVWFTTGTNTLCKLDVKTTAITQIEMPIRVGFPAVTWMSVDSAGSLIVGATMEDKNNIVVFHNNSTTQQTTVNDPFLLSKSDTDIFVHPIFVERSGRAWYIARSLKSGLLTSNSAYSLLLYNPASQEILGNVPLQGDGRSMIPDKKTRGVYWIGTISGLVKVIEQKRTVLTLRHDEKNTNTLNDSYVRSFARDNDGNVWVGTVQGLHLLKDNTIQRVSIKGVDTVNKSTLTSIRVNILYNDPHEGMLVGTNYGIFKFDTRAHTLSNYYVDSIATLGTRVKVKYPTKIWAMQRDKSGALWVGTNNEGLYRWVPGAKRAEHYVNVQGDTASLNNNKVWSILEDSRGTVWIGTERGAARWNPSKKNFTRYVSNINKPFSLCGNIIWNIVEDDKKNVWFGCFQDGLSKYRYDTDDFESITYAEGLPVSSITGFVIANNTAWISSYDGFIEHQLGTQVFRTMHEGDGFQGDEYTFKCVMSLPDGRIMFGGLNGMTIFRPKDMHGNESPPSIAITSFKIFGEPQPQSVLNGDTITLTYQQNVFSFEFAALNFFNPAANRYSYMLESYDREWSHDDFYRRYAAYTNVAPGTYRFRVKASNSDDVWNNQGIIITVIITPPWWGTWWARTLFGLLVIGVIVSATILYGRVTRRRAEQRQALVQSQMQALRAQMNPHFMFNALNSVQRLILKSDVDGAVMAMGKFAKLVRMTLESTIHSIHTLRQEIEWLTLYLELEKLRYGAKLNFTIGADSGLQQDDIEVPTMVIQPFVENAIRHGIFHKETPGTINVNFTHHNNHMTCTIQDDGVGRARARELTRKLNLPTTSVGINSTTERLQLLNENRPTHQHITMNIEDLEQGTRVVLQFPILPKIEE
ncbi:MAG: two-component regulator propeller domain-containing protein [Candidatus Kapaibacterium sp.]